MALSPDRYIYAQQYQHRKQQLEQVIISEDRFHPEWLWEELSRQTLIRLASETDPLATHSLQNLFLAVAQTRILADSTDMTIPTDQKEKNQKLAASALTNADAANPVPVLADLVRQICLPPNGERNLASLSYGTIDRLQTPGKITDIQKYDGAFFQTVWLLQEANHPDDTPVHLIRLWEAARTISMILAPTRQQGLYEYLYRELEGVLSAVANAQALALRLPQDHALMLSTEMLDVLEKMDILVVSKDSLAFIGAVQSKSSRDIDTAVVTRAAIHNNRKPTDPRRISFETTDAYHQVFSDGKEEIAVSHMLPLVISAGHSSSYPTTFGAFTYTFPLEMQGVLNNQTGFVDVQIISSASTFPPGIFDDARKNVGPKRLWEILNGFASPSDTVFFDGKHVFFIRSVLNKAALLTHPAYPASATALERTQYEFERLRRARRQVLDTKIQQNPHFVLHEELFESITEPTPVRRTKKLYA